MIRIKINDFGNDTFTSVITNYLISNCVCKFVSEEKNADIIINKIYTSSTNYYDIRKNNIDIYLNSNDNYRDFIEQVLNIIIKAFNIDSLNFESFDMKDLDNITEKEIIFAANYDKKGNTYSKGKDDPYISKETAKASHYSSEYVVCRNLDYNNLAETAKYVGSSLANAINECDKHTGYKVYNEKGEVVYTSKKYKISLDDVGDPNIKKHMKIRNKGIGIRIGEGPSSINIPDGTDVIVTKKRTKKSEILIYLNGKKYYIEVNNSILSEI